MVIILYAPPALGKTMAAETGVFADIPVVDTDRILEVLGAHVGFTWERFHSDEAFYGLMLSKLRDFLGTLVNRDDITYVFTNFKPTDLQSGVHSQFTRVYAFVPSDRRDYERRLTKKFGSLPEWADSVTINEQCEFADETFFVQPGQYLADQIKNVPLKRY